MSKSVQTIAIVFGSTRSLDDALARAGIVASSDLDAPADLAIVRAVGTLATAVASHLRDLRGECPDLPVILVCDEVRPGEMRQALAAGAVGVVLDEDLETTLAACVAAALAGQVCVPRRQARQVEPATLSAREKQILGMVVMGYMNGEIAERLFVAESTVKSHLSSAFGKLDVRSRNEAVELILDGERGLGIGILGLEGEPIAS